MTSINRRPQPPKPTPSRTSNPPSSPRPPSSNRQNPSITSGEGLGRSPSLRAPNGLSRPGRSNLKKSSPNASFHHTDSNVSDDASGDDARAADASVIDELKERLRKAETASEEFQRQLTMLETRLDESLHEQWTFEEKFHESEGKINELVDEKVHLMRQKREAETLFESERAAMAQDQAKQKAKEEELASVVQRLKTQKEARASVDENKEYSASRMLNLCYIRGRKLTISSDLPQ